ncbi:MAG: hypothetical protein ACOC0X_01915 [Halobacteriota archaeon]
MLERRTAALLALLGMALLAGCLDVTHEVTVEDDGTIEEYRFDMVMDEYLYNLLEEEETEPGQSLEESILEDTPEELPQGVGDVSADVTQLDDGDYRLSMEISEFDPAEADNITVDVDDDTIYFEDLNVEGGEFNETEDDEFDLGEVDPSTQISYEYILHMPGEIQDSNAHEVDGNTATWDVMEMEEGETVWAEGTVPDDSSPLPGLGVTAAVVAFLLAGLGAVRLR